MEMKDEMPNLYEHIQADKATDRATGCSADDEMEKKIPANISNALLEAFKDDADSCARVLYFLSKNVSIDCAEPFIRSLQSVMSNAMVFKKVAERMAEDTKTAEEDPRYRQMMCDVWNNFLKDIDIDDPAGGRRLTLAIRVYGNCTGAQFCFMRAVSRLPPESFRALATTVSAMGRPLALYEGKAITFARKTQPVVRVAFEKVYLAANVIMNIKRWWKGEITGVRCAKNIIDCGVRVAAGIGGGIGGEIIGASVGSFFGPVGIGFGMVVGAIAGGMLAATTAESLCDRLTQWMFGLPKSEALEKAYTFLGTSCNDSNSVVNSHYRRLALLYHPDKGGDAEKWTRLQYSMAIIKEARGEP
ncbi:uncharacterized protein LOC132753408 isoform X2 [Ruditapes philippinarum]|uniref:uncharacterized protein LOC132753408 isoform X2 n=1 Tax=Ruditapes philippinarum TaxID=129788 RepID=UPI00295BBC1E|nr:uncharacterized protein LOC132753408 isoform X2 [Ruditapes philippinarum]